jgi:hypothetical protein
VGKIRWTPERVLSALRAFADEHGRPPTAGDWSAPGPHYPSRLVVRKRFGCWNAALQAAGLTPTLRAWTNDQITAALRAEAQRRGRRPRAIDWDRAEPDHPSRQLVRHRFGTWSAAVQAAGL